MADITVTVSSPGLVAYGESNFGSQSWGGEGFSLPLSQGTTEFVFNTGWGSNLWGEYTWGIVGSVAVVTGSQLNVSEGTITTTATANITTTGQQLNVTPGQLTITGTGNVSVTGSQANVAIGNEDANTGVSFTVTGQQLNTNVGNVTATGEIRDGWGVYTWGSVPWGGGQEANVNVTGSALAVVTHPVDIQIDGNIFVSVDEDDDIIIYQGNATLTGDANVLVTGSRLNVLEGLGTVVISADANVSVTGSRLNTAVGQVVGGTQQIADVTGSQVNIAVGNTNEFAGASVSVTGSRLNTAVGQVTYNAGYNVTGSRANLSVGTVTFTISGSVLVSGSRLNIIEGSANTTSWQEVNTGVNNTWSPVDLAA